MNLMAVLLLLLALVATVASAEPLVLLRQNSEPKYLANGQRGYATSCTAPWTQAYAPRAMSSRLIPLATR